MGFQRRIVWDSRNLGQTGCSRSRDPDTGSLPLCRLPDDVYLGAVPGGTCYLGRAAKLEGLRWIFLQPGLRGPSRHVPCDRAHRRGVERTCRNHVPSHPATGGRAASSGWGAAAAVSMVAPSQSQRLAVLQETPERPLQPRDPGIPACGRVGSQSWLLSPNRVGK